MTVVLKLREWSTLNNSAFFNANRITILAVSLPAMLIGLLGLPSFLNPWLTTVLALGVLLAPGWLVLRLVAPTPPFSRVAMFPLAFVLAFGLLSPLALLVVGLRLPLAVLGYVTVVITLGLGGVGWVQQTGRKVMQTLPIPVPEPAVRLLLPAVILTGGMGLYLFLVTMSTWSSGDTWYLRYIRDYMAGVYDHEPFNLRASWWILQAWQNEITGLNPLDTFSFYLPPVLMLLSLLGVYGLARELFGRRSPALLTVLVQQLFMVSSINSHDWLGRGFFDRIIEDKFLIWLMILPVVLLLALRYLKTGQRRLLGGLGLSYIALTLVHPLGLVQGAVSIASLGLVHLLVERRPAALGRVLVMGGLLALLVVVPLLQRNNIWGRQSGEDIRESPTFNYALATGVAPLFVTLSHSRLQFFSAVDDNYIAHPHLIAHPLTLLAILLAPLLWLDLRRSLAAQFLISNMAATLFLLYTPVITPLLGRVITPWMVYRLSYGLPVALVLAYLWQGGLDSVRSGWPRQHRLAVGVSLAAVSLLALLLNNYITEGISFLQERRDRTIRVTERDLLDHLAKNVDTTDVIIARDNTITYLIPAFTTARTLYRNASPSPRAREAVTQFYQAEWLTPATLQLLQTWKVSAIIVEQGSSLAWQMARLPAHFTPLYQNEEYTLYRFKAGAELTALLKANSLLGEGRAEQAVALYQQILGDPGADALTYLALGQAYQQLGQPSKAEAAWRQALEVAPGFNPAAQKLAGLLTGQGQTQAASAILAAALNQSPVAQPLPQQLGDLYLAAGQTETARHHYRQSLLHHPNAGSYHLALAVLYLRKGLLEQAQAEYNTVISLDTWPQLGLQPDFITGVRHSYDFRRQRLAQAYIGLANLYRQAGQLERAETAYRQAIALMTDQQQAYIELATLYRTQRLTAQATRLYQQAAWRTHNAAWPHVELGKIYLEQATASGQ